MDPGIVKHYRGDRAASFFDRHSRRRRRFFDRHSRRRRRFFDRQSRRRRRSANPTNLPAAGEDACRGKKRRLSFRPAGAPHFARRSRSCGIGHGHVDRRGLQRWRGCALSLLSVLTRESPGWHVRPRFHVYLPPSRTRISSSASIRHANSMLRGYRAIVMPAWPRSEKPEFLHCASLR